MIVIVEGIDRVGKTTLCNKIEDRYRDVLNIRRFRDDLRYVRTHCNKAVNTEKINTVMNFIESGFLRNIIFDRFHITEFVYGAVERSYKNEYMFDIDRRLADIDKPDTPIDEELEDGENVIDPGMSFDGHIQNDVVLIYVVPVDIKDSSSEHGYNLERHLRWFDDFYVNTKIKNKVMVDYRSFDLALKLIDDILRERWGIELEVTSEPIEPLESDTSKVYESEDITDKSLDKMMSVIRSSMFFNKAK